MIEEIESNEKTIEQDLSFAQSEQWQFTVTPIENTVIEKAAKGDEKAFEEVFMCTYRYVFAAVKKYLKNEQDAYDAIQDTYTRVYKNISRLEATESFYPWLHRIAENCAKDILRFSTNDFSATSTVEENTPQENSYNDADVTADVSEVLKQLPKEQVDLLIRVYYDKMRVSEIARMQNLPATTVHNRLKAAKKKLKELLRIRGIDKPIYGGEFVSVVSAAIRNAIGTELLSMAVAEEILHNVTGSKNKKGAFVVSAFARRMRNNAAKKLASMLLLASLLITVVVLLIVGIIARSIYVDDNDFSSVSSNAELSYGVNLGSLPEESGESLASNEEVLSKNSTSSESSSESEAESKISNVTGEDIVLLMGNYEETENLGTFTEDGYLGVATTLDRIYALEGNYLISAKKNTTALERILIKNFKELYGESGCFLNVFEDRVYWINQNSEGHFVLNRCNIDGNGHYTKIFDEFNCTFITNMVVTADGVYFLAGIHGVHEHTHSATLYQTDFDFNIKNTLNGVADYTFKEDKIYYLYGYGNSGSLFCADRYNFENRTNVSPDKLSHGSLSSVGDYLVLGQYNKYAHTEGAPCTNLTIIDYKTGEIARIIHGEGGETVNIKDVSPYNGGTIIFNHNGILKTLTIATGEMREFNCSYGTICGEYKYFNKDGFALMSEIYEDKFYSLH